MVMEGPMIKTHSITMLVNGKVIHEKTTKDPIEFMAGILSAMLVDGYDEVVLDDCVFKEIKYK